MSRPEWMKPGEPVAIFTSSRMSTRGGGRISYDVIDRVMKRDVVLESGERFNADSPKRHNGTWDPSTELLRRDDPRVLRAVHANAQQERLNAAARHMDAAADALRGEDERLDLAVGHLKSALIEVELMKANAEARP